ncbi:MAG: reverse transcriptase domain-containing protein [Sedimenticola sp.]
MARTLTDIADRVTNQIRILNPFPTVASINQDAEIGYAEPRTGHMQFIAVEQDMNGNSTIESARRIQVRQTEPGVHGTEEEQTNHSEVTFINLTDENVDKPVPGYLQDLYKKATVDRSAYEKEEIRKLLIKYQDAFSKHDNDLGLTNITEHSIDTGDATPIKQPPRRVPIAYAEAERVAIQELEAKGVIRKSSSPWASPIVLVKKPDGKMRPCVDYRRLNAVIKNVPAFPLPRIGDCLDAVAGAKYFSTFDLTSGYFQIPMKESDIPKTAFCTKYGQYEFLSMPFGLNSSAATFQRTMELILQGLQWTTAIIYIDDIVVFAKTFDEHVERVSEILERIVKANLKLKPVKTELLQKSVIFLGHTVSEDGISPHPGNIIKITQWERPRTVRQVKHLLGMGSYYRRFVKGYATIAKPLTELTRKGKKFVWTEKCEAAFQDLKQALVGTDIMGHPNDQGEFILDVDGSVTGIGAVLHQVQEGQERVIAYGSRALNRAESNYCITQIELLAVRYFIEHFRQYLLGRKFLVRSDHQALVWLFRLKEPRGRIARWIEVLSAYDFTIEYRPGKKMGNADALSRCENPRDCECPEQNTLEQLKCGPCTKCRKREEDMMLSKSWARPTNLQHAKTLEDGCIVDQPGTTNDGNREGVRAIQNSDHQVPDEVKDNSRDETTRSNKLDIQGCHQDKLTAANQNEMSLMAKSQAEDEHIGPIYRALEQVQKPSKSEMVTQSPETRHYWVIWETLSLIKGVMHKTFTKLDGTGTYLQCVVPTRYQKEILHQVHNSLLSGHLGRKRTRQKLLKNYYWYNVKADVNNYIVKCDVCESDKPPLRTPRAPLGSLQVGAPMDCLATDILGPLPKTPRGNRYILVVADHFSKWVEIFPIEDQTAETCARVILNEVIARFGTPLSIHSDQGRNYESQVFKELCRMLEVKKTRCSPKNPRGNGVVERFNKTLVRMIKAYLCGEQQDWDLNLGCLASAYRSSQHEATSLTPNLLMLGRETRLPAELVFGSTTQDQQRVSSYGEYVEDLKERMQKAHAVARKHLHVAATRHKELYDTRGR